MVVLFPLVCFSSSILHRLTGRYLNGYFIVKRIGGDRYELFFQPAWGYYYATDRKFYRKLVHAITVFEQGYPDTVLIAQSLLFTSLGGNRETQMIQVNRLMWLGYLLSTYLTLLLNVANYRREKGRWKLFRLLKKVYGSEVIKHTILNK